MRIKAEDIDHNIAIFAEEVSQWIIESDLDDRAATINLAYIAGACQLGKQLKEAIKL